MEPAAWLHSGKRAYRHLAEEFSPKARLAILDFLTMAHKFLVRDIEMRKRHPPDVGSKSHRCHPGGS